METELNSKTVSVSDFGILPSGEVVKKVEITNKNGIRLVLMNYGATTTSLICADKDGVLDDILLGFDNLEGFLDNSYFGSTIGRFANRICKGRFSLNNKEYQLNCNNGENHLHGGVKGWDKRLWQFSVNGDDNSVHFRLESHSGEENYPGKVEASVTYQLTDDDEVSINFGAETDEKTLINMTNHAFFNLGGQNNITDILDHVMEINSSSYLPVDDGLIPTGERNDVSTDMAFDFRTAKRIGQDISLAGGYDHNYCFDESSDLRARVYHEPSGRQLEVKSSLPGMQFYSGNFLNGKTGKANNKYGKHTGFALEPQFYPDNINHDQFQSSVTEPGQRYEHYIKWKLSVRR